MDILRHHRSLSLLIYIILAYYTAFAEHRHRHHHNLSRPRREHPKYYYIENPDIQEDEGWGPWTAAGECSRSCGGGVTYEVRDCLSIRSDGTQSCKGPSKRYYSCNIHDCADNVDFRAQQCSFFDNNPFDGFFYKWVPYTKAQNKCELNCMPRGERFYFRHKRQVIDGTPCDDEKPDICVNGKCLPVGCDRLLGSSAREDKCRICGGDGSSCTTIKGVLDRNDLQVGYSDLLLIPAGAMNIRVRELQYSNNYLAIRNLSGFYYLNGNWRIDFPKSLRFIGTVFHYERNTHGFYAAESITALGPITESIYIVMLFQEKNADIEYEYSITNGTIKATDSDGYQWLYSDFSNCSAICGGGFKTRDIWCARKRDSSPVSTDLCDPALEPIKNQSCAQEACPPKWVVSEWSHCSRSCGNNGTQNRTVHCEQILSNGIASVVDKNLCETSINETVNTTQSCNVGLPCPKWYIGPWKSCDKLCGNGFQRREVRCYYKINKTISITNDSACIEAKPESEKSCFIRPCEGVDWIASEWSGCEEKCDVTYETRSAVCSSIKGKSYPDSYCKKSKIPHLIRECKSAPCEYQWYASQWSECSSKCGSGIQDRKVFCLALKEDGFQKVNDSKCEASKKYETTQNCTGIGICQGDWYTGPWGACSKSCGGGTRSRTVLCLLENKTVEVSKCNPDKIIFASDTCNNQPCGDDEIIPLVATSTVSEKDVEEECEEYEDQNFITVPMNPNWDTEKQLPTEKIVEEYLEGPEVITHANIEKLNETSTDLISTESEPTNITGIETTTEILFSTDLKTNVSSYSSEKIIISSTESISFSTSGSLGPDNDTETTTSVTEISNSPSSTTSANTSLTDIPSETTSTSILSSTSSTTPTDISSLASITSTNSSDSTSPSTPIDISSLASSTTSTNSSDFTSPSTPIDISSLLSTTTSTNTSDSTSPSSPIDNSSLLSTTTSTNTSDSTSPSSPTDISSSSSTTPENFSISTQTFTLTNNSDSTSATTPEIPTSSFSTEFTSILSSSRSAIETTTSFSETEISTNEITLTESSTTQEFTSSSNPTMIDIITKENKLKQCKKRKKKIPKCESSEFGCCFDGISPATGPFSAGCPEINTCKETKYGCCPDEASPAEGRNNEGCIEIPCEFTLFGCCSDNKSVALGNNNEGCPITTTTLPPSKSCNTSEFGCCLDGNTTATGQDFEGCPGIEESTTLSFNCSKSQFGCCPDGVIAASGPDSEGCIYGSGDSAPTEEFPSSSSSSSGITDIYVINETTTVVTVTTAPAQPTCSTSEFGCCSDNLTAANGPNQQGCCLTSPHGCCPDNIHPATGPNLEGCTCEYSKFGCCSDSKTPAQNESRICNCESTRFGCCPDGIQEAQGENFFGCLDITKPGQICIQSKDKGSCRDFTVKWFFDTEYGGCSRFWYGGCEGNENRFKTQDECKETCVEPRGRTACYLPKISGPCEGYYPSWYYDPSRAQCLQFIYGGCLGNNNKFQTRQECESLCLQTDHTAVDICSLPKDIGPCRHSLMRWYYNSKEKSCKEFSYGGCLGNENRFHSEKECVAKCHVVSNEITEEKETRAPTIEIDERNVTGDEGNYATLRCRAVGFPSPTVIWQKDGIIIDRSVDRYRFGDGLLQIVGLNQADSGTYLCIAENGVGEPTQQEVYLYVRPQVIVEVPPYRTELPPVAPVAPVTILPEKYEGAPEIDSSDETNVFAEEGSYATFRCAAKGNPQPNITWHKGVTPIDRSDGRYKLNDGVLQVIGLYKSDSGIYTCIAENGIGEPKRRDYTLNVRDAVDKPADIVSDPVSSVVVSLEAPSILHCYAYGFPRPAVLWWKGDIMLPTSSDQYEQRRDYSLVIRRVTLKALGPYTCQAYNGLGRAASSTITLHAVGPVIPLGPEDLQFVIYLVPSPQVQFGIKTEPTAVAPYVTQRIPDKPVTSEIITTTVTPTPSTPSQPGIYVPPDCTDNPFFANCALIVKANYCQHKYYGKFCCRSCTLGQQLPSSII